MHLEENCQSRAVIAVVSLATRNLIVLSRMKNREHKQNIERIGKNIEQNLI